MMMESCRTLQTRGGWWEDVIAKRCHFPIAPINTFSNLAYILVGLGLSIDSPTWANLVMGIFLIYLGISSGLYHGFKTIATSRLDHVGMYVVFGALTIFTIAPTHPHIAPLMALGAIGLAISLTYTSTWKYLATPILGVLIALSTLGGILNGKTEYALLSFAIFLFAYWIWWMDRRRTFFLKRWGHGLWHVLTAIAIVLLFKGIQ